MVKKLSIFIYFQSKTVTFVSKPLHQCNFLQTPVNDEVVLQEIEAKLQAFQNQGRRCFVDGSYTAFLLKPTSPYDDVDLVVEGYK